MLLNCHDVDEAWSIWHYLFMSIINFHAPIKTKRIRGNSLHWLDGEILQLMRQRHHAHKIAKTLGLAKSIRILTKKLRKHNN